MSIQASASARDLTFNFDNSCNCCWRRQPAPSTPVYVDKHGEVRRFNFSVKAADQQAIIRSVDHIKSVVNHQALEKKADGEQVWKIVEAQVDGFEKPLTLAKIRKIQRTLSNL